MILTEFGSWLFGSQLSAADESKLKTAELGMTPKAEVKEAKKEKEKLPEIVPESEEKEAEDEAEEAEEEEADEDEEDEEAGEDGEDGEDESSLDEEELAELNRTGRSALWEKLMPARAGSAKDAAERMKTLAPPNPKQAGDHKHALLYLENHAGGNTELIGIAPKGADRKKALRWLQDALLKISESHDKSYQLPVKWLIGNYRLWQEDDDDPPDKDGFYALKNLAMKKLEPIGKKYEQQYRERKLGVELGFVGQDLQFTIRPRQDHYLKLPGYFGLKEPPKQQSTPDALREHVRKQQSCYIIYLLAAVHGIDHLFQEAAKRICESCGGECRAPPCKGFMRMWAKLDTDHKDAETPRAAENIDTNRVAWIFQEPEELRKAFDKAQKVLGAPLRVKNGYDPNFDAMTETKGYRNILANYKFSPGLTWGNLSGRCEKKDLDSKDLALKTHDAWENFRSLVPALDLLWLL